MSKPEFNVESDAQLAARIRYVAGPDALKHERDLDEAAWRYGLKRRRGQALLIGIDPVFPDYLNAWTELAK